MQKLTVFVEGDSDAEWTSALLRRVFPRMNLQIRINSSGGKASVLQNLTHSGSLSYLKNLEDREIYVGLIDADTPSLPDARRELTERYRLGDLSDQIFFAVPTLEAWLFADVQAAKRVANQIVPALDRVQFPDEIPMPKHLAERAFGRGKSMRVAGLQIIETMNIERALSRSPSLREFLTGIAKLLGENRYQPIPDAERLIGRRLLGQLVSETNPSSRVLYKTLAGDRFTAERLADEISQGTPIARQYAADLLRVARELLAREAALDTEDAANDCDSI